MLTRWSQKRTALPSERPTDPISVGLPGCPRAHCTCWERHWCSGMLRQEGGMTPEGLVDGVKAPPGLSAFARSVSRLTRPVRPSTDQAFIRPSPVASAPNKATIWSPWISKSFFFWFPLHSACVFSTLFWMESQVSPLSDWVFGELCIAVRVFCSLSTRIMVPWWDN